MNIQDYDYIKIVSDCQYGTPENAFFNPSHSPFRPQVPKFVDPNLPDVHIFGKIMKFFLEAILKLYTLASEKVNCFV